MDDLLNTLGDFSVTSHANNPNAEHPHFSLYKCKASGSSQSERRKRVLEARKEARYDLLMHLRQIEEGGFHDEDDSNEEMDYKENPSACYARPRRYKNFVMLSEWLVDVPEDFAQSHLSLPCPMGKRCIVVTYKGRTRSYGRNGMILQEFSSVLPNGMSTMHRSSGNVLLDCIWSERSNTFYIIDLVVWGRQSMADCDTLFRFEFLKSRINELDEDAAVITNRNRCKFVVVPYSDCSNESLQKLMSEDLPFDVNMDGVLFYHRESHYTHGPTPLVGWLKPFMFQEILDIAVPEKFLKDRPLKYVSLPNHIQHAKELREQNICKREAEKEAKETMEVAAVAQVEAT